MRSAPACLLVFALLLGAPPVGASVERREAAAPSTRASLERDRAPLIGSLPLAFEANLGQGLPGAGFHVRTGGIEASLFDGKAVLLLLAGETVERVEMLFPGSSPEASLAGTRPKRGRSNYFLGNDPDLWIRDVPHFGGARVAGLYPGIDLLWAGEAGSLRYDFRVAPGASPGSIRVRFEGALSARVDATGGLEVRTENGRLRHSRPVAFQEVAGLRVPVRARFTGSGPEFAIALGSYDRRLPLVIDPTVEFSTLIGPGNVTRGGGAAVDGDGYFYFGGYANIYTYPVKNAYQGTLKASDDIVITKFDPVGNDIVFSTYIGSTQQDRFADLALDADNAVYFTGYTGAYDSSWPAVNAWIATYQGGLDAMVTKLGPNGNTLEYSTYLGGSGSDRGRGIAVDAEGSAWVVGITPSLNFPLSTDPLDDVTDGSEAFVVKFTASGKGVVTSTYLGGAGDDGAYDVAVDRDGVAWVTGYTNSSSFPLVDPVQEDLGGGSDAFLTAISSSGDSILFSSFFGGDGSDTGWSAATDPSGRVFVAGQTFSTDLPTVNAVQESYGNSSAGDVFVLCLDPSTATLSYATYLGGSGGEGGWESGMGIAVDGDGRAFVTGYTTSTDFPVESATQATLKGEEDIFVTVFSADGSELLYSSYHGGSGEDHGVGIGTDGGDIVIAGHSRSTDFPKVDELVANMSGQTAGVVLRIDFGPAPMRGLAVDLVQADRVDLSWRDPHAGAYDVEVERRTGDEDFEVVATVTDGSTTWSDPDVVEDGEYTYRIRGTSEGGKTPWSAWVTASTLFHPPTGLEADVMGNLRVDLSWEDPSGVEVGYEVWRRTVAPGEEFALLASLDPDTTDYTDDDAVPETEYEYRVRGTGPSGVSGDTNVVSATTPPADPGNLAVLVVNDIQVQVSWTDHSSAETGFEMERRNDSSGGGFSPLATPAANAGNLVDSTVTAETGYSYRVRAVNTHGTSEWAAVASATTAPATPPGITALPVSPGEIAVSWTDASQVESGFLLERALLGTGTFSSLASLGPDTITYADSDVLQETGYEYRVRAWNADGNSRFTKSDGVRTFAQLVIEKARWWPAKGKKGPKVQVVGRLDVDPAFVNLNGATTLRVNGGVIQVSGYEALKKGKVLRHEQEGVVLDLLPSSTGSSNVLFILTLTDGATEMVDPDGDLVLRFTTSVYDALGTARLTGGGFDPKKGIGAWVNPLLHITSFKAGIKKPANHTLALKAIFAPYDPAPAEAPPVRILIGPWLDTAFYGDAFTAKGSRFILKEKGSVTWILVLDPVKGTLSVKGKGLDLGDFSSGRVPLRIVVSVGDREFEDEQVFTSNGKILSR